MTLPEKRSSSNSPTGMRLRLSTMPLRANIAETLLVSLITEQGGKEIQHEEHEDILSGPVRRAQRDRPAIKGSPTAPTLRSSPLPSAGSSRRSTSSESWLRPIGPNRHQGASAPRSGGLLSPGDLAAGTSRWNPA